MRVHNFLPQLLSALKRWDQRPSKDDFDSFLDPMRPILQPMLDDFGGRTGPLYEVVEGLNWDSYRQEALLLDPVAEENRFLRIHDQVERCLGMTLTGDAVLFGAFTAMDGYARFNHGKHVVYLGVDESHGRGAYLDILISHELAHVAREPLPEIWAGFGLTPDMNHDAFVENLSVIEHLMGEGFSCVVSELLHPREPIWHYTYQTEASLKQILDHGPAIDRVIHRTLRNPNAHYQQLYNPSLYRPELPRYCHYVWAWLWTSHLLKDVASGNPRRLLKMCSKDLISDALSFTLPKAL